MTKNELINILTGLCLEIEDKGRGTCFVWYHGHIKSINVRVHIPHWTPANNIGYETDIYLDDTILFNMDKVKECIETLKKLAA